MFKFFEDVNREHASKLQGVTGMMWHEDCMQLIQSSIHVILKEDVFNDSGVTITNTDKNGNVWYTPDPELSTLLNNPSFKRYLYQNDILTSDDIEEYFKNYHSRGNQSKHGKRRNETIETTDEIKLQALHFLFKLCFNIYKFKLGIFPNAKWNKQEAIKLLKKPEEKIVEKTIQIEKIVEKTDEKSKQELEKIKKEHNELKSQFHQLTQGATETNNFNLLNKLTSAKKCLEEGDNENAKILINNVINIDISCYTAHLYNLFLEFNATSEDELIKNAKASLAENKNYKNILKFCSDENILKIDKINKSILAKLDDEKYSATYEKARDLQKHGQYIDACNLYLQTDEYKYSKKHIRSCIDAYFSKQALLIKKYIKNKDYFNARQLASTTIQSLRQFGFEENYTDQLNTINTEITDLQKSEYKEIRDKANEHLKTKNYAKALGVLDKVNLTLFERDFQNNISQLKNDIKLIEQNQKWQKIHTEYYKDCMDSFNKKDYEQFLQDVKSVDWEYLNNAQQTTLKKSIVTARKKIIISHFENANYYKAFEFMSCNKRINFGENLKEIAPYLLNYANFLVSSNERLGTADGIANFLNENMELNESLLNIENNFHSIIKDASQNNVVETLKKLAPYYEDDYSSTLYDLDNYEELSNWVQLSIDDFNDKIDSFLKKYLSEINLDNCEDIIKEIQNLDLRYDLPFVDEWTNKAIKHNNEKKRKEQLRKETLNEISLQVNESHFADALNTISLLEQNAERETLHHETVEKYQSHLENEIADCINKKEFIQARKFLNEFKQQFGDSETNIKYIEKTTSIINREEELNNPQLFWDKHKEEERFFKWCIDKKKNSSVNKCRDTFFSLWGEGLVSIYEWLGGYNGVTIFDFLLVKALMLLFPIWIIVAFFKAINDSPLIKWSKERLYSSFLYNSVLSEIQSALKECRMPKGFNTNLELNTKDLNRYQLENYYLDIKYKTSSDEKFDLKSHQKNKNNKPHKTRKEKLSTTIGILWGLALLTISALSIGLGIIHASMVGALICGIIFGLFAFVGALTAFWLTKTEKMENPTKTKLAIAIIALWLSIAISLPALIFADKNSKRLDITYSSYTCTVNMGLNNNKERLDISPYYDGYQIKSVYLNCSYNRHLTTVVIPEGVTYVDLNLSDCFGLKKLILPSSLTQLSKNSLDGIAGNEIYFRGSREQWNKIHVANSYINASIHYNYYGD